MNPADPARLPRYARQLALPGLGLSGQRALLAGRALIVGVGGLGTWTAELLARAGVGFLRLADPDVVELTNIHRQALYDESDAAAGRPKVYAAARRLARINSAVAVEPAPVRVDARNIASLAGDVDVVVDGTDNFLARFIINDFCVKTGRAWVFAGAVGAEAQLMTILPGQTACLRCILPEPPPPCLDPTCRLAGVFGPAVAAVAALQAAEALKILAGRAEAVCPSLIKLDVWTGRIQSIRAPRLADGDCPCCQQREFEYLDV